MAEKLHSGVSASFPSFHVPKNSFREVPHQSIKKLLHNFGSWEDTLWDPEFSLDSVVCPCNRYRHKLPDRCFMSGHVATGCEEFEHLLPGRSNITSASAASANFPGRNPWMSSSKALFDQWLKRHKLRASLPQFEEFCKEQWHQHVQMLEQTSRLNWAMVQKVKALLHHEFVSYNEDHNPNHVVCYCPRCFLRRIKATWDDPKA